MKVLEGALWDNLKYMRGVNMRFRCWVNWNPIVYFRFLLVRENGYIVLETLDNILKWLMHLPLIMKEYLFNDYKSIWWERQNLRFKSTQLGPIDPFCCWCRVK